MADGRPIFLDTTIQIERLTGTRARRAQLTTQLAGKEVLTSTYVLGEFLCTLVKDCITLYTLVSQNIYLDDVEVQIANRFNKREASRCLLLWAALHRPRAYGREKVLYTLHAYIEYGLVQAFMAGVDRVSDATGCGLAQERPHRVEGTYRLRAQCRREVKECHLGEWLARHSAALESIASHLRASSDSAMIKVGKLLDEFPQTPQVVRGRHCTWYLGDLIIALECPADANLHTTNRRHFDLLCAQLGKRIHEPEGPPVEVPPGSPDQ
jgi:predicted nucleic acid-binding protein